MRQRMPLRRFLLPGVILASLCAMVAGGFLPGGRSAQAATGRQTHQPVTLTFAVEFTDAPTAALTYKYIINPFEKAYPWITVKLVQQNGAAAIDKYLKTSMTAGAGPDVFDENGPSWMAPFADAHQLLPLDKYAKQFGWAKKILPFAYETSFYHGSLISLPAETETLHLWYNKTIFKKYGWTPPTTYAQLLTLGKAIQSKGLVPFAFGASDCEPCWEWWQSWALNAYVGPQALFKLLTAKTPWTDPAVAKSMAMLKQLWDLGFISNKQATALSFNDGWGLFGSQKAVMKMEGTWGFSPGLIFNYAKGFDWGIAPLPVWRAGVPAWPPIGVGEVEGINGATKHPDEAALFLNWFFQSPKANGKWIYALSSQWVPPIKYTSDDLPAGTNPLFKQVLLSDEQAMATGRAGYLAWSAWPSKTEAYMWSNAESLLYGKMSIPAFLQGMEKQFKAEQAAGSLPTIPPPAK